MRRAKRDNCAPSHTHIMHQEDIPPHRGIYSSMPPYSVASTKKWKKIADSRRDT